VTTSMVLNKEGKEHCFLVIEFFLLNIIKRQEEKQTSIGLYILTVRVFIVMKHKIINFKACFSYIDNFILEMSRT